MEETGKVDFSTSNSYCGNGNTSTTTRICDSDWSVNFISAKEVGETIEFLYKEISNVSYSILPPRPPEQRVFKIIFSCKDGKWHKSEKIYGEIIPASDEEYIFE